MYGNFIFTKENYVVWNFKANFFFVAYVLFYEQLVQNTYNGKCIVLLVILTYKV